MLEYFQTLLRFLEDKLFHNVPRGEKADLDLKKLVWNGDIDNEPEEPRTQIVIEKEKKVPTRVQAAQTPHERMI